MTAEAIRALFMVGLAVYALAAFMFLAYNIRRGNPWRAALAMWLGSPIPLLFTAGVLEQRNVPHLLDPTVQSAALLFGDLIFLPFMAALLALAWRKMTYYVVMRKGKSRPAWYRTWQWTFVSAVFGLAAGILFHLKEFANYALLAWYSPDKLVHDLCSYPVLAGGLFFGLIPALFDKKSRKFAAWALLGLGLWFALVVFDNWVHPLDGRNMHEMFDYAKWRVIPYPNFPK